MEDGVDHADQAAVVIESAERVHLFGSIMEAAPGEVGRLRRNDDFVKALVAGPERFPGGPIGWLQGADFSGHFRDSPSCSHKLKRRGNPRRHVCISLMAYAIAFWRFSSILSRKAVVESHG